MAGGRDGEERVTRTGAYGEGQRHSGKSRGVGNVRAREASWADKA